MKTMKIMINSGFDQIDISRDRDIPRKIVENAEGKKKTDEMSAKWQVVVEDS